MPAVVTQSGAYLSLPICCYHVSLLLNVLYCCCMLTSCSFSTLILFAHGKKPPNTSSTDLLPSQSRDALFLAPSLSSSPRQHRQLIVTFVSRFGIPQQSYDTTDHRTGASAHHKEVEPYSSAPCCLRVPLEPSRPYNPLSFTLALFTNLT